MKPIKIEIIAPLISAVGPGCRGCGFFVKETNLDNAIRRSCDEDYPPEFKQLAEDLLRRVDDLRSLYMHRLQIQLVDAQSPWGIWMQVRHRIRKFPAFIVEGKAVHVGWDSEGLESVIDEALKEQV
jgi:hypothetical protein